MERIDFSGEISDGMVLDLIDDEMAGRTPGVPFQDRLRMRQEIFHSIRKLDILQDLLEDPEITEIMINGDDSIFIEKRDLCLWKSCMMLSSRSSRTATAW